MMQSAWLPGILVLLAGLAAGLLIAWRLRRGTAPGGGLGDLRLRIADLEARRADLYHRLEEAQTAGAPEADRVALETAAARTLLELDRARADLEKRAPGEARRRRKQSAQERRPGGPTPAAAEAGSGGPRGFASGFAFGAGLVVLVGGLLYWAGRDVRPATGGAATGDAPAAAPSEASPHDDLGELPAEVAARIETLRARLATQPDDLAARVELGYILLGSGRYFDVFEESQEILARDSDHADGLYLQGVVRLTMGQRENGAELLRRALISDPQHADALVATGVLRLQDGDYPGAIAAWERGREVAGAAGQGELDRLIEMARAGRPVEEILGSPQPAAATSRPATSMPAPATPPTAAPAAGAPGTAYSVEIELASGLEAPPGATLFVILRGGAGGPPSAVRRIAGPTFPLRVTLDESDSMMGGSLPASGTVSARLDADGSASTRDPSDLAAEATAELGSTTVLTLDRE